jgi:hypothetical protein
MGTPARTSILLALRTRLAAISVAGGYKTTLVTFDDSVRAPEEVGQSERPYLAWEIQNETNSHSAFSAMRWKMGVLVVGYVYSTDWATRSAAVNNIADDVLAAIFSDETWSQNAVQTTCRELITNENERDNGGDGICVLDILIEYERSTTAS